MLRMQGFYSGAVAVGIEAGGKEGQGIEIGY